MKLKIAFILLLCLPFGCTKKPQKTARSIPVKVAVALRQDVPSYIKTVGLINPYNTVNVMAQANGQLVTTFFKDGADVKQGDLLYLIDQRPYLASLKQAEGNLEESLANLQYAERTAERNSQLAVDEYISQDRFDQLITTVQADQGIVKQNQAQLNDAEINLGYTTIYAPMDARAGKSLINDGNLILENVETTLVTLNQITPIYATFYINEKDLPEVQRHQKNEGLTTLALVEDPEVSPYEGKLTIIDNQIDPSTGMIKLWATFPNEDKTLWPNQYVKVKLILETLKDALLIPQEAVQTNEKGTFVFVVKGDQTVEIRAIEVGQLQEDNLIVVTSGIKPREVVVTEGQINLRNGSPIRIKEDESKF